jgi:hypothetical protein
LHQGDGVALRGVAVEDDLILLGEIDADGGAAEREEIALIAELGIEQVWRERLAERVAVARIADAAGHRQADAALMQHRERTVEMSAAVRCHIGEVWSARIGIGAAEA